MTNDLPHGKPEAVQVEAKRGCRHCYGRGWCGWDAQNVRIVCRCVIRRAPRGTKEVRVLAARPKRLTTTIPEQGA